MFSLYIDYKLHQANTLANKMISEAAQMISHYPETKSESGALLTDIAISPSHLANFPSHRQAPSLFARAGSYVSPGETIALHVNGIPNYRNVLVNNIALEYGLPQLPQVLTELYPLVYPAPHINVWKSFCMQCRSSQDPNVMTPPRTVQALPPSKELPFGRCDTVLVPNNGFEPSGLGTVTLYYSNLPG